MKLLRLLFWSLVAGTGGAALFTAVGQFFRLVGGSCNALCKPEATIPAGFLSGLLVIGMLEHDRRARERSLDP
ncbi:MAG: hypothetical protein ACYC8T_10450 [Myxococcaceae bacterium]